MESPSDKWARHLVAVEPSVVVEPNPTVYTTPTAGCHTDHTEQDHVESMNR